MTRKARGARGRLASPAQIARLEALLQMDLSQPLPFESYRHMMRSNRILQQPGHGTGGLGAPGEEVRHGLSAVVAGGGLAASSSSRRSMLSCDHCQKIDPGVQSRRIFFALSSSSRSEAFLSLSWGGRFCAVLSLPPVGREVLQVIRKV